jgi:hypothetical protein
LGSKKSPASANPKNKSLNTKLALAMHTHELAKRFFSGKTQQLILKSTMVRNLSFTHQPTAYKSVVEPVDTLVVNVFGNTA